MGNIEILSCHWAVYFRDSFLRVCMVQPLDICKADFERFVDNIHANELGTTVNCAICMEKKLQERLCNRCHNSVCQTCAKKIAVSRNQTCPFCRADLLSPEARELLHRMTPSSHDGVPRPRAYPLRAQMPDGTFNIICHNNSSLGPFMQQVADKVIATGQTVTVYIDEDSDEENQYCRASPYRGKVRMEFDMGNSFP